jgi:hypothetical protein
VEQQPALEEQWPALEKQRPALEEQRSTLEKQRPALEEQRSVSVEQQPAHLALVEQQGSELVSRKRRLVRNVEDNNGVCLCGC